jgi:hypothetical protein
VERYSIEIEDAHKEAEKKKKNVINDRFGLAVCNGVPFGKKKRHAVHPCWIFFFIFYLIIIKSLLKVNS